MIFPYLKDFFTVVFFSHAQSRAKQAFDYKPMEFCSKRYFDNALEI